MSEDEESERGGASSETNGAANDHGSTRREIARALSQVSQIAVTIFASVFIGVMIGRFLDGRLGTSPWLLLTFSFLGVGAAFKLLFDMANKK